MVRRALILLSGLAILGLVLWAPGTGGLYPVSAAPAKLVKIGVDLPMSGG